MKDQNAFKERGEFFPCRLYEYDSVYTVEIASTDSLFFFDLLEEYGLYGNGPCWEGIVEQILERDMPEVLNNAMLDSEADAFLIRFPNEHDQKRVGSHIHAICVNESKFREYLEWIDKDRIDA